MIRRLFSRLVVDPCVRAGRIPSSGLLGDWFRKCADSRVIRVNESHPLFPILNRDDWKTPFSISDHTLMWLWRFVNTYRPRAILEMGSGMSTIVFALYASRFPEAERPRIVSMDHDQSWLNQTIERCEELQLKDLVDFQLAEITDLELPDDFGSLKGYSVDHGVLKESLGSPELILIDGPPSTVGRQGTLPSVFPIMTKPATVLVDDAHREAELRFIDSWVQYGKGSLQHECTYGLGSGLGRLKFQPR